MSNILVLIGGIGLNFPDIVGGELIKNRTLTNYIQTHYSDLKLLLIDTFLWKSKPFSTLYMILKSIFFTDVTHVILSVSTPSALRLLKLIYLFRAQKRFDLTYLAIGGTLGCKLANNQSLVKYLTVCDRIKVETMAMAREIKKFGIDNVGYLPNFKDFNYTPGSFKKPQIPINVVYLSKVCEEKGVQLAIEAVMRINYERNRAIFLLDIYGPIKRDYKNQFLELISRSQPYVTYKGILNLNNHDAYKTLATYDIMIFPTFHSGEGFPSVIIDAYIAGLPVLASEWRYNSEIVTDFNTGRLFRCGNINDLIAKMNWFANNLGLVTEMRRNCVREAGKYRANVVVPELIKEIGII